MPDAKVKVDMWLWPMIGFHPIILVFWARNGRGYGPRFTSVAYDLVDYTPSLGISSSQS
jgi:hypothetical protein